MTQDLHLSPDESINVTTSWRRLKTCSELPTNNIMTGRRSSARQAAKVAAFSTNDTNDDAKTGTKRKSDAPVERKAKQGRKAKENKGQTTLEDTISQDQTQESRSSETKDEAINLSDRSNEDPDAEGEETARKVAERSKEDSNQQEQSVENTEDAKPNGFDHLMDHDSGKPDKSTPEDTGSKVAGEDDAVAVSSEREESLPSNILEKGVIYFFFRGRVGIDDPGSVNDIARSYIILRPLPDGAKLESGPIGDSGRNKMLSLPKKVLPVSPKDRFMTFVEKANASMDDIKDQLSASEYATKTVGVRHTPAATPVAEGVYAITKTGRETHLAYIITIPDELNDVQKGIGLRQKGSYVTSAKNPQSNAPANAQLPQPAEYPQEILDEFGGRGWMPLQPKLLDYQNTQFLLIGHGSEALEKATKAQDEDGENEGKRAPLDEIQSLEDEDERRVEGLGEDHAVFSDLGLNAQEFPKLQTTW